jgi:hypothetical protein
MTMTARAHDRSAVRGNRRFATQMGCCASASNDRRVARLVRQAPSLTGEREWGDVLLVADMGVDWDEDYSGEYEPDYCCDPRFDNDGDGYWDEHDMEAEMAHATAHDGYDYDIPEDTQGTWQHDEHGIPVFVPNPFLFDSHDEFLRVQAEEDDLATQAYFRTVGMGSWLTRMDRRWAPRVYGGSPA